jgi:hypothetical protein
MGRATDPGENHDPGKDQRFTPSLTQEPRLENGLGQNREPGGAKVAFRFAPIPAVRVATAGRPQSTLFGHSPTSLDHLVDTRQKRFGDR